MKTSVFIHLVIALTALAVACAAYGFWYHAVGKESQRTGALSEELRVSREESARVAKVRETLANIATEEESIRARFVHTNEIVPFLERIEDLGVGLGSSVEVLSVGQEEEGSSSYIRLSIKITGSFDAVLRTLGALEYSPYDARATNVVLDTPRGPAGAGGAWTAAATFRIGTRAAVDASPPNTAL